MFKYFSYPVSHNLAIYTKNNSLSQGAEEAAFIGYTGWNYCILKPESVMSVQNFFKSDCYQIRVTECYRLINPC